MPNTKPVGVAYSDPELTSGTTIDSATITSSTVTSPTVTGEIVTGAQFKSSRATAITAAATLAIADSGGIFTVAQSSAYDIDLPSPTVGAGLRYLFQLVSPGAFNVTITVAGAAATFEGTIINDVTSVIPCTGRFPVWSAPLGPKVRVASLAGQVNT